LSSSSNGRLAGGAVAHDGGDDVRHVPATVESLGADVAMGKPKERPASLYSDPRVRPEPRPGSRAHARVGIAPTPESVTDDSWNRLAVHVSRALESATTRGASPLRAPVNVVVAEMRLTGAPWDVIERTIVGALTTHPDFDANDRLNVVSGKRSSDALIARVIGWVHRARQSEDPAGPSSRTGGGDRIDVQKVEHVLEALPPVLDRHLASERGHTEPLAQLDRALARSVMELRFALNEQTFEYLRWRVKRAREVAGQSAATAVG
jgi:hypothetical protein